MQHFKVYQSLWAMERRRPDELEWTLDEKLTMIRDAGFDGCGVRFADFEYAKTVTGFLRDHGMSWQAQCYPRTVDDLKPILEHVHELGADHLNLQPDVRPYTVDECVPYIEGWRRLAEDAGIAMHIGLEATMEVGAFSAASSAPAGTATTAGTPARDTPAA